jgi:hypothetical protein
LDHGLPTSAIDGDTILRRARYFRVAPLPRELGFELVFLHDAIQGL